MRILVTGGAGFIGRHTIGELLRRGHVVASLDLEYVSHHAECCYFHGRDIRDLRDTRGAFSEFKPEAVLHLAAQVSVPASFRDPYRDSEINVLGSINVLEAARQFECSRFVFASSGGAIYGDTEQVPTPEQHVAMPASLYGAAKLCGEAYGGVYAQLYGLEFVALRYANVYGPRQDPHGEAGVVAIFARKLLGGERPVINGDGTQSRDYVYVGDVVRANLLAAAADRSALGAYNVGTGRETDVNALFAMLRDAAGVHGEAEHGPAKPGEQRRSCLDAAQASRVLGWSPQMALEEGLRTTVEFFREAAAAR